MRHCDVTGFLGMVALADTHSTEALHLPLTVSEVRDVPGEPTALATDRQRGARCAWWARCQHKPVSHVIASRTRRLVGLSSGTNVANSKSLRFNYKNQSLNAIYGNNQSLLREQFERNNALRTQM
jgi:hypothetical protein